MQFFCVGPAHNFWLVFNYTKEGNKLCVLAKFSWFFWFGVLQGVVNALKRLRDSWMKGVMKEVYCCFRGGIILLGKPLSLRLAGLVCSDLPMTLFFPNSGDKASSLCWDAAQCVVAFGTACLPDRRASQCYPEVSTAAFWLAPSEFGQHGYIMCRFIEQFELWPRAWGEWH